MEGGEKGKGKGVHSVLMFPCGMLSLGFNEGLVIYS